MIHYFVLHVYTATTSQAILSFKYTSDAKTAAQFALAVAILTQLEVKLIASNAHADTLAAVQTFLRPPAPALAPAPASAPAAPVTMASVVVSVAQEAGTTSFCPRTAKHNSTR